MSTLRAQLRGRALEAFLTPGPVRRALRHARRRSHTLDVYLQLDDGHSHLLAQALERLLARHPELEARVTVVPAPAADADPEPELRSAWTIRDAKLVGQTTNLEFPERAEAPPADRLRRANAILLRPRPAREQLAAAVRVGDALWRGDAEALAALTRELGTATGLEVTPELEASYRALRKKGHYQGAMVHFGGEWFWGVDRLPFLLAALQKAGVGEAEPLVREQGTRDSPIDGPLEVFFSFRSPYSYLAIARLAARPGPALLLRPVLPMVMRGLPVPRIKRFYIARDAKRLADRQGVPFGRLCDPVGAGVERCIAVLEALPDEPAKLRFAQAAMEGIWSRAVEVASDPGLLAVAEQAGVDEATVRSALADEGWRATVEENRRALREELGLWGVPSFRLGSFTVWGQDRMALLDARQR